MKNQGSFAVVMAALLVGAVGCSKSDSAGIAATLSEDTSASGVAASSVGGAISNSSSTATSASYKARPFLVETLMPAAFASTTCPTIKSTAGAGCTANGSKVDLTYSSCTVGQAQATWSGMLEVSLATGSIVCGTFPTTANLTSNSISRVFVSAANTPGSVTRTTVLGTVDTIDDSTANLGNFDGVTIATAVNGNANYGSQVGFNGSGARNTVVVQHHISNSKMDHSVTGSLAIAETGTTRTVTGSTTVYHNKLKVIATSTFNSVVYNDTSCYPVSGSLTTVFTQGAHVSPTVLGNAVLGRSETLTFTGAGTATLVDASGTSSSVAITHCY